MIVFVTIVFSFITMRRYASAVYAVVMCPSVYPSVCLSPAGTVLRHNERPSLNSNANHDHIHNVDRYSTLPPCSQ